MELVFCVATSVELRKCPKVRTSTAASFSSPTTRRPTKISSKKIRPTFRHRSSFGQIFSEIFRTFLRPPFWQKMCLNVQKICRKTVRKVSFQTCPKIHKNCSKMIESKTERPKISVKMKSVFQLKVKWGAVPVLVQWQQVRPAKSLVVGLNPVQSQVLPNTPVGNMQSIVSLPIILTKIMTHICIFFSQWTDGLELTTLHLW